MERSVEKGRKNQALYNISHAALEAFPLLLLVLANL